jgi:alpha-beta hydrolase superfamily lysophospholipase
MRSPLSPPKLIQWTAADGYVLSGRVWTPAQTPARSPAVLYLHGIQSHGGWFEWSASLLAQAGLAVILPDRRGSGLNAEARGDTPAMERWLEDIDEVARWATRELGPERFLLVGASWGGKLAAAWALREPGRVRGLLLVAPGLYPRVGLGPLAVLKVVIALLVHSTGMFPIPLRDAALFTDNPAGRAFIAGDPLALQEATARFLHQSRRLDRLLLDADDGALRPETLLLLAQRDRIIRNEPTVAWLERVTSGRCRIMTLPGASHTLEFEQDSQYEAVLRAWAQEHARRG